MACLNFIGFEIGDASEIVTLGGTGSVQSTVKRTGGYAFRANPTTTATGYALLRGLGANGTNAVFSAATVYLTFYFQYATKPGSASEQIASLVESILASVKLSVRLDSDGKLSVYDSATTIIGSPGATVLSADTWYRIELSCGTGEGAAWELKVDGTTELSGVADSTFNTEAVHLGKFADRNGQTVDFFYDDVWIDSAVFRGAVEIKRMAPDGDGNYTAWTGGYTDVDEVPHNSDTDYVTSATSGQAETVALASAATTGITGTVHAVKSFGISREPVSVTSAHQVRLRSATTDDDTTSFNLGTSYTAQIKLYETDPATGAAWLLAALDSVEVGVESNASQAVRCTALCAMVAYTPAGGGGTAGARRRRAIICGAGGAA